MISAISPVRYRVVVGSAAVATAKALSASNSAAAAAADRVQTGLDRVQTGLDRVQTGLDRTATEAAAADAASNAAAAAGTPSFSTRTTLKAADTSIGSAILFESGRNGSFVWDSTVPIATHQADALDGDGIGEGMFIAPNAGAIGAWRRIYNDDMDPSWWGLEEGVSKSSTVRAKNRNAIQRPLDLLAGDLVGGDVRVPPGTFEYTGTIHVGYGQAARVINFYGSGEGYGGIAASGTTLYHMGPTTDPAINYQGLRNPRTGGFSLLGTLITPISNIVGTPGPNRRTEAAYNVDGSRGDGGDGRYNPYAGITIDAYSGTRPGTPYSNVVYPAFLSIATQYGKGISSNFLFENIDCRGFIVGLCNNPGDNASNGDYLSMRDCTFLYHKYCLSVGNSQSRLVNANHCLFNGCYASITNKKHGQQTGQLGGVFSNCEFGICAWVADVELAIMNNMTFNGCGGESMWALFKTTGSGAAIISDTCRWNLSWQNSVEGCGLPQYTISGSGAIVEFKNTNINSVRGIFAESPFVRHTGFGTQNPTDYTSSTPAYWRIPYLQTFPGCVSNGFGYALPQEVEYRGFTLNAAGDTSALIGWIKTGLTGAIGNGVPGRTRMVPAHQEQSIPPFTGNGVGRLAQPRPFFTSPLAKSGVTFTITAGIMELTITAGLTDEAAFWTGYMPGDALICRETGTRFMCKSRVTNVMLYELQNNLTVAGSPFAISDPIVAIPTSGNFDVINCRVYQFPNGYAEFSHTSGSPTLTLVNGVFPTEVTANDGLLMGLDNGAFLHGLVESRVSSSNGTTTITMGGNARKTGTSKLAFAVRVAPANAP